MLPILSIVGHSGSGKTTLIERLIGEMRQRGKQVAVIKHSGGAFDVDRPGKDTWRYAEAGCQSIAILGRSGSALLTHRPGGLPFEQLLGIVGCDVDLVLVEGLHDRPLPKIEVHRAALGRELRCPADQLLAVVTDEPLSSGRPELAADDPAAVCDLIEKEIIGPATGETLLLVNGAPVPLGSFTRRILAGVIEGLVGNLKGIGEIKTVSVSIRSSTGDSPGK